MHYFTYRLIPLLFTITALADDAQVASIISINNAVTIPSVKQLDIATPFHSADFIQQAVNNAHWQSAMQKLRTTDRTYDLGKTQIPSFDLKGVLDELVKSSNDGVFLASYQGYVITMQLTMKRGVIARKYIPVFTTAMANNGLCEGYNDLAFSYAHGWVNDIRDYKAALSVLEKGKAACSLAGVPSWQQNYWGEYHAQFQALEKERERLKK